MWVGEGGSYRLIHGVVLVLALFLCVPVFYDEVYFKVVGPRHPGAPQKAQASLKQQTEAFVRVLFFFLQSNESHDAGCRTAS